ncbi:MAG: YXWGXW repeat-containing protein, partial [Edaphobacter sp.]
MRSISSIHKFVLAAALMLVPAASFAGVFISVNIAPPVLPVYSQPLCPGDGYLWTPGYWGWGSGAYLFHAGYWGPHVGFYGGVNYGFGYTGRGYEGGYW